jgi:hypothetical protein
MGVNMRSRQSASPGIGAETKAVPATRSSAATLHRHIV